MNILASDVANEVLADHRVLLGPTTLSESLFIYADHTRTALCKIDDAYLRQQHVPFEAVSLTAMEAVKAVRLAADVDDGEAEALAIASERVIPILTDDNAALRLAPTLGVATITTLDLLYSWAQNREAPRVRTALSSMRVRANYAPPRRHALRQWYIAVLDG
jgi:predicted nucleic acid-binding protein